MKTILSLYRKYYGVPEESSTSVLVFHFIVFLVFFFSLGFAMSQLIVYLVR